MLRTDNKWIRRLISSSLAVVLALTSLPFTSSKALGAEESFRPENEDLYFGALNEVVTDTVKTTAVYKDTFVMRAAAKGEVIYENTTNIFNQISIGRVKFAEYLVRVGQHVNAGDPIARVTVTVDKSDINELASQIATAEKNFDEYVAANNALLDEYSQVMKNATSYAEKRMAELLYNRLSVNFKNEKASRAKSLDSMRNQYADLCDITESQYIVAEGSGVVGYLNRYRRGDNIGNWGYLGTIYDTSKISIRIPGGSENFRFNQAVTIVQKQNDKEFTLSGRIVSCKNTSLSPNLVGTDDYIEVYGDTTGLEVGKDVIARVDAIVMENALMVPNSVVQSDSKGSYVYLYKNGIGMKRYILTGGSNSEETWVINGLNENDLVVVR